MISSKPKAVACYLVPFASVLITFLTGIADYYNQGVPWPWKNVIVCPGPGLEFACYVFMFSWIAFALDTLFYTTIGYGLLFGLIRMAKLFRSRV